jgi:hypothetical protein
MSRTSFADRDKMPDKRLHTSVKKSNWASEKPAAAQTIRQTDFEDQVQRLGLTEAEYIGSRELRWWCEQNRNRYYVPEWLLKEWGIAVDADSGG